MLLMLLLLLRRIVLLLEGHLDEGRCDAQESFEEVDKVAEMVREGLLNGLEISSVERRASRSGVSWLV